MKVIILAGGKGTRLGRRTSYIPKPMLLLGKKPILWHIMKIYSYYGYNDFIICLGYLGNTIKNYFYFYDILNKDFTLDMKNNNVTFYNIDEKMDWKVTLVNTGVNASKSSRIKQIKRYLDSDINMLTYGDGLADINIQKLLKFHKSQGKILTITGVHPPSRFGEIFEKDNKLMIFSEKPQTSASLINGGFMVFQNEMLDYLGDNENYDFEQGPLVKMVDDNNVAVYKHLGSWDCVDNERDYQYLNKLLKEDRAFWKIW
ncbi:MAG: sugar phosphate nucleotidyltransferase [Promethearchaeota archaeon]